MFVDQEFITVYGRVLPSENVCHFDKSNCFEMEDGWANCLQTVPMFCCVKIKCWVVLTPNYIADNVKTFIKRLQLSANAMSFHLPNPDMLVPFHLFIIFLIIIYLYILFSGLN